MNNIVSCAQPPLVCPVPCFSRASCCGGASASGDLSWKRKWGVVGMDGLLHLTAVCSASCGKRCQAFKVWYHWEVLFRKTFWVLNFLLINQGLANESLCSTSSPLPASVKKVLWEHRISYSFTYCPQLFSSCKYWVVAIEPLCLETPPMAAPRPLWKEVFICPVLIVLLVITT